jgi:hypothetical protein
MFDEITTILKFLYIGYRNTTMNQITLASWAMHISLGGVRELGSDA